MVTVVRADGGGVNGGTKDARSWIGRKEQRGHKKGTPPHETSATDR